MFSGGFYSDDFGYVAQDCKKCPNGSYVPYDQTPGKSVLDCKTCPQGKHVLVHKCDLPAVKALYARVKDISKPKENFFFSFSLERPAMTIKWHLFLFYKFYKFYLFW